MGELYLIVCIANELLVLVHEDFNLVLLNEQLDTQFFFVYVYFNSLYASSIQVLIIRRFNCINKIYRGIYTRYRIDTIESPDDAYLNARNI